jgi:hypothetical protein
MGDRHHPYRDHGGIDEAIQAILQGGQKESERLEGQQKIMFPALVSVLV